MQDASCLKRVRQGTCPGLGEKSLQDLDDGDGMGENVFIVTIAKYNDEMAFWKREIVGKLEGKGRRICILPSSWAPSLLIPLRSASGCHCRTKHARNNGTHTLQEN